MKWRTSLGIVYFLAGFTLMATLTMVALIFSRPLLGDNPTVTTRYLAMLSPLALGVPFGIRVAWLGMRDNLKLISAIKRAFGRRPTETDGDHD